MEEIKFNVDEKGMGAFTVSENKEELGELVVSIERNVITAIHTEVNKEAEGRGLGKKLFNALIDHARANNLKIKPLCPYVQLQFKRNSQTVGDLLYNPGR